MANFFPAFSDIESLKQKPTEGEYHALKILKDLSDEYEVYFQPYINGYNPDIIIVRKNYGVLILEVKDWQLQYYIVNPEKPTSAQNQPFYTINFTTIDIQSGKDPHIYAVSLV